MFWKLNVMNRNICMVYCKLKWENGPKMGFLNLLKNLVVSFFLKFPYNESTICYITVQM